LLLLALSGLGSATGQTLELAAPGHDFGPAGNAYLVRVLQTLEQQPSIVASIRHESRLYGQQLMGSGKYWQLRSLGKRLTNWEMQTQIAGQTASFSQIYDGNHLWTDRRLPSGQQIHRLDVAWLQAKLRAENRGRPIDPRQQIILALEGQGGLGQMLGDLLRNFDFQPPQPTQLNGDPVNALVGHWRTEQLARLWPAGAELEEMTTDDWPAQLPHHVMLLIRTRNLFPCVCEHRTAQDAALATQLGGLRPTAAPLLRYEIFEVQTAVAIPEEKFQYVPGDVPSTDETNLVYQQLTQQNRQPEPSTTASHVLDPEVVR
jgi:hypothetical protein